MTDFIEIFEFSKRWRNIFYFIGVQKTRARGKWKESRTKSQEKKKTELYKWLDIQITWF